MRQCRRTYSTARRDCTANSPFNTGHIYGVVIPVQLRGFKTRHFDPSGAKGTVQSEPCEAKLTKLYQPTSPMHVEKDMTELNPLGEPPYASAQRDISHNYLHGVLTDSPFNNKFNKK